MATDYLTPVPVDPLGKTLVRQDDHVLRETAISVAVNPPDEQLANWIAHLRLNALISVDRVGILALLNEEFTDYAAHRVSDIFHAVVDTANTVPVGVVANLGLAITRANQQKAALRAHMLNTGGAYHAAPDTANEAALGAVPDATDAPSLLILALALKVHGNAHLDEAGVHVVDDADNEVTTADPAAPTLVGPLRILGDMEITGDLTAPTLVGPVSIDGNVVISGSVSCIAMSSDTASIATIMSSQILAGIGHFTGDVQHIGPSAWAAKRFLNKGSPGSSTNITIAYDVYEFGNPTLPSNVTVVHPAPTPTGIMIEVFSTGPRSNGYTFYDATAGDLCAFPANGYSYNALFVWNGTSWSVARAVSWAP